ncbi:hypothetical protein JTE90_021118 [Oedothorax gibbosus]|uniref:C2H2-type domain-containing protein n=1 Tax=Oedothorax gibbosus TaxID=931172 RepID=A0AAV6TUW5_9ARAC|nr:hypothetical protein JTE90_021118 [Oedothorax gibbosus]
MSTFKSKEEVGCAHCSWRGRRDKLTSHTSSKHEAERPREKNQASLLSVFFGGKNSDPNSKRPLNEDEMQPHPDEPYNKLTKVDLEQRLIEPLPSTSQNSNFVQIDNDVNITNQLSSINQAILCLNEKVSEYFQKSLTKPSEQELSCTMTSSSSTPDIEEFEAKLKLIRISRSVTQICNLMPCLLEEAGMIKCIPCITNYKNVPKDISVLRTASLGQFSLPEEEQLIQENQSKRFGNFKGHLIDHLKSSAHK